MHYSLNGVPPKVNGLGSILLFAPNSAESWVIFDLTVDPGYRLCFFPPNSRNLSSSFESLHGALNFPLQHATKTFKNHTVMPFQPPDDNLRTRDSTRISLDLDLEPIGHVLFVIIGSFQISRDF